METLPSNLAADIQAANDSTPLADLVKLGVALAQARDTEHDTFQAALKLKNLIAPHMGEDPLKTLVGLKQCKTAGAASGGGVFSIMRGLDGDELEAWLDKPENLAGFAAGMEDAAAVLASPGVIHILGSIVAGWQTAIGTAPESVTEYSALAETHRRISEAYKALIPGAQMWEGPGDVHTGLVAVMAAAKHKQLTGDPAAMATAVAELSRGLEPMLNDPDTVATLGTNRELMSAWMDSYAIMGAVWNSDIATETLLQSEVFRDELLKAKGEGGGARIGLVILTDDQTAWKIFMQSQVARSELWASQVARSEMWASQVARSELWASQVARSELWASQVARSEMWASQVARSELWASQVACRELMASQVARSELWASQVACRELWASQVARSEMWANMTAWTEALQHNTAWTELWNNTEAFNALLQNTTAKEKLYTSPLKKRITKTGNSWQGSSGALNHYPLVTGKGVFLQRYENYSNGITYPGGDGIDIDGVTVGGSAVNNYKNVLRYNQRIGVAWYGDGSWLEYIPA